MKLTKIMPKQKKGSALDILVFIVLAFVIVMFFALWVYGFGEITDALTSIDVGGSDINVSGAAQDTFGQIEPAQRNALHLLSWVMIISMAITILLSNFLVKSHPSFFVVYLMIVIVGIITSAYIANHYETLMTDPLLGATISEFTGASYIILYLPIWVTIIGLLGAIFLFAGIMRDAGAGGGIA